MSRPLTAAALVAAALAAAAVTRRRLQARSSAPAGSGSAAEESPQGREWRCDCGQEYIVTGADRHRVYWPAGASRDEPLLEARCVSCGEPLPATREVTAA